MILNFKKVTSIALAMSLAACGAGPEVNSPITNDSGSNGNEQAPTNPATPVANPTGPNPVVTPTLSESALRGKALYEQVSLQCVTCHGVDGKSTAFISTGIDPSLNAYSHSSDPLDVLDLASYLEKYMPQQIGNPEDCVGECAIDIAAYIKSWNVTAVPATPNTPITSDAPNTPSNPTTPNTPAAPVAQPMLIQAEEYSAAFDNESNNLSGDNASTLDGVDVGHSDGNGLVVGYTVDGEWLEYSINVPVSSNFALSIRSASGADGGSVDVSIDNTKVASNVSLPKTGGWDDYKVVSGIALGQIAAGRHVIRIDIVDSGINLDWFELTPLAVSQPPAPTTPAPTNPVDPQPVGDVANGEWIYNNEYGCIACHGADFSGPISRIDPLKPTYSHSTIRPNVALSLSDYISEFMPVSDPTVCVGKCADDLAAYIRSKNNVNTGGNTPQDPNDSAFACDVDQGVGYGVRNVRLLSIREYENTLNDLLGYKVNALSQGVPQDSIVSGFSNQFSTAVSEEYADAYASIAKQAANFAASNNFSSVVNCSNDTIARCANKFVNDFAPLAFRRPLTIVEKQRYVDLFNNGLTQGDKNEGLKIALEAILNSPYFLMRSEMGVSISSIDKAGHPNLDSDAYVLTSYEIASFLSYMFTGSMPDKQLFDAADKNQLSTDTQMLSHIDRMLATEKAREHFGEFAAQWFNADFVRTRNKDESLYPTFNDSIKRDMAQEIREIFKHVMFDGNYQIGDIYGNFTFLNRNLANYYNVDGNFDSSFSKVSNLENRGGVLASGAFMAGFAKADVTSPIVRGVAVRESLLCQDVPPMPNDLSSDRDKAAENLDDLIERNGGAITTRQKTHFLTKDAPCSSCHEAIINPQGFGLEDFDAGGLHRDKDKNNLMIDASGQLIGLNSLTDGQVKDFTGARGLSNILKELPKTRSCYNNKAFKYVIGLAHNTGENESEDDTFKLDDSQKNGFSCAINSMEKAMINNNNSPREAFRALGISDIIKYRK